MNNNNKVSIQERTKKFAVRIIKAYSEIIKSKHFTDPAVNKSKVRSQKSKVRIRDKLLTFDF